MADDKHYVPGDFYRICDRTGFKIRSGKTKKEWNGRIVRKESWEPRQPQDLVRGIADYQAVPEPRPRPPVQTIQQTVLLTDVSLPGGGIGYGPPLQTNTGGLIYTNNPPGPGEIHIVDPSKYPASDGSRPGKN